MDEPLADLIKQLSALRRGAGLTASAIARAPAVLAALGNPPPEEARRRLIQLVRGLGDDESVEVLAQAYAIDYEPAGKVSHRRETYSVRTGRAVKTIIKYEDARIRDLALVLTQGHQSSGLLAAAWVRDRVMTTARVEFGRTPVPKPSNVENSWFYDGLQDSLPVFLYMLPDHFTPDELWVGVLFQSELPTQVWSIDTPELFGVSTLRYERRIFRTGERDWYVQRFRRPQQGHYYGIAWTFDDPAISGRPKPAVDEYLRKREEQLRKDWEEYRAGGGLGYVDEPSPAPPGDVPHRRSPT